MLRLSDHHSCFVFERHWLSCLRRFVVLSERLVHGKMLRLSDHHSCFVFERHWPEDWLSCLRRFVVLISHHRKFRNSTWNSVTTASFNILSIHYSLNRDSSILRQDTGWWAEEYDFSFLHNTRTGSGAPATYPIGIAGLFSGGQAAAAWSWPLTFKQCRGQEWKIYTSTPPYIFMAWCSIYLIIL
jgi:hypothetical protein